MGAPDSEAEVVDAGQWLVDHRAGLDRGEAEWLERLAAFDRDGLWALDGHFGCVTWLIWRAGMRRSTAFEKLRIAHELTRRPIIKKAFDGGDLSYSAVRAITRLDRPAPEVDEALVELAKSSQASILDIEKMVRTYNLYADQERPPAENPEPARDLKIRRGENGTGEITITLRDLEIEEFAAALQAFMDLRYRPGPVDQSSAGDSGATDHPQPVDRSSPGDSDAIEEAPLEEASRAARKADAFMDLVNSALATADGGQAHGDDRYLVHLVSRDGGRSFNYLDGTPVHPLDADLVTCDCSSVTHTVGDRGEPLNLGRKTREWNTAQRRAIAVRDGGHCRFPGCAFSHYDIHHLQAWEAGGLTDVANGCCQCRRHHRMLHAGYQVRGDPNGQLDFHRPDGSYIGTTHPAGTRTLGLSGGAVPHESRPHHE
jgi:hypothetical protein